jgi:hypothetical protein
VRRGDGRDDALADARDDRLLGRAADQPGDVGAHRGARLGEQLDAVLGDGGDARARVLRAVDDARVDAGLHRLEHVAAGEVDAGRRLERELDAGAVGRDQRAHDVQDIAAREVVRLQVARLDGDAGLDRGDLRLRDRLGAHLAQRHHQQLEESDVRVGREAAHEEPDVLEQDDEQDQAQDRGHDEDDHRRVRGQKRHTHPRFSLDSAQPAAARVRRGAVEEDDQVVPRVAQNGDRAAARR